MAGGPAISFMLKNTAVCVKVAIGSGFSKGAFPGKYPPGRGALPGGKLGSPSYGWERRNDIIKVGKRGSESHYCSVGPTRAGGWVAADPIQRELAPTSSQNSTGDAAVGRAAGWDDNGTARERRMGAAKNMRS